MTLPQQFLHDPMPDETTTAGQKYSHGKFPPYWIWIFKKKFDS
jgi:hypothetical protein